MRRDAITFLDYVRGECAYSGVRLRLEARKGARDGSAGWFESEGRSLYVAVDTEGWLCYLAHELAHMHQWREQADVWVDCEYNDYQIFYDWLDGQRYTNKRILSIVRGIQRCELDAERRAIKLIRTFNLTNDLKKYIKGANMGVWAYELVRRNRKWWTDFKSPYSNSAIMEMVPERLIKLKSIGHVDEAIETAVLSECF